MRKLSYLIVLWIVFLLSSAAYAQCTWQPVGPDDYNQPSCYYSSYGGSTLVVDKHGTPYVLNGNGLYLSVSAYNGTDWSVVGGTNFGPSNLSAWTMAVDGNDNVYVVFVNNSDSLSVMMYNGTQWAYLGNKDFIVSGRFISIAIAVDKNDIPYIAFQSIVNFNNCISVMKFNGTQWVPVGTPGFAPGINPAITIDSSGTPYVAYKDGNYSNQCTVVKFNGSSWINVGIPGFSAGTAFYPAISISKSDSLYVAYGDNAFGNKATVMKFDGNAWVGVGNPHFSAGAVNTMNLAFDTSGKPCVAYLQGSDSMLIIMNDVNGIWKAVAPYKFHNSGVYYTYTGLGVSPSGTTYVLFQDSITQKPFVYTRTDTTWQKVPKTDTPFIGAWNCMTSDDSGNVYLAWASDNLGVAVAKYNGVKWDTIGAPKIFNAQYGQFAFDRHKALYIVIATLNSNISVLKYTGSSWVYVGKPNFSAYQLIPNCVPSLAFDTANTPFVALGNYNTFYFNVMYYTGGMWQTYYFGNNLCGNVGSILFNKYDTMYVSYSGSKAVQKYVLGHGFEIINRDSIGFFSSPLVLDSLGQPWLCIYKPAPYNLCVIRYNGHHWDTIGPSFGPAGYSFSQPPATLALNKKGIPYVCYIDAKSSKLTVVGYNGSSWTSVGQPEFPAAADAFPSFILDTNSVPYASYQDIAGDIWVRRYQGPMLMVNASADTVCMGGLATLTASGMQTYSWSGGISNGVPFVVSGAKTYTVIASSGGCYDTAKVTLHTATIPAITFTLPHDSICVNNGSISLTATPPGGNFSGVGVTGNTFNPSVSDTGLFKITYLYTTKLGCSDSGNFTMDVLPMPTLHFTLAKDTVCIDSGVVHLNAAPPGGSFSGNGVSGNSFNPLLPGAGTDKLTYFYTDKAGCSNSISQGIVVDSCNSNNSNTGINSLHNQDYITIYPNPSNGLITLNYSLNGGGNVRTTIVNELGQVVYDNTAQKGNGNITEQLNLGSLASGIYSLRLQTDNSIMVRKVVLMGNR